MAKVAVITRTKDRPVFLRRALMSVQNQTFDDYEHVIVNDGGDRVAIEEVINELSEGARKHIKLFHGEPSNNQPDTILTSSVDRSDSEYVVIHDDDDSWHQEFLSETVSYLDKNKSIGGVVARANKIIEEINDDMTIRQLKTEAWMGDMKAISLYRQCIDNQLTPIAFLYRRSAYENAGRYDNKLPVCGDWDFGIRFLQKYDVDFLDPGYVLANYHHRKFKPGSKGNTSYAGNDRHRYYTNKLTNKYLRQELAEGKLGVGYIMSKLRYDRSALGTIANRLLPRFVTRQLKKRVEG